MSVESMWLKFCFPSHKSNEGKWMVKGKEKEVSVMYNTSRLHKCLFTHASHQPFLLASKVLMVAQYLLASSGLCFAYVSQLLYLERSSCMIKLTKPGPAAGHAPEILS